MQILLPYLAQPVLLGWCQVKLSSLRAVPHRWPRRRDRRVDQSQCPFVVRDYSYSYDNPHLTFGLPLVGIIRKGSRHTYCVTVKASRIIPNPELEEPEPPTAASTSAQNYVIYRYEV